MEDGFHVHCEDFVEFIFGDFYSWLVVKISSLSIFLAAPPELLDVQSKEEKSVFTLFL